MDRGGVTRQRKNPRENENLFLITYIHQTLRMQSLNRDMIYEIAMRTSINGYHSLKLCCKSINQMLNRDVDIQFRSKNTIVTFLQNINFTTYQFNKMLHRDNNFPALIGPGVTKWYKFGVLHRDNNLPAATYIAPAYNSENRIIPGKCNIIFHWIKNGVLHREKTWLVPQNGHHVTKFNYWLREIT